MMRHSWRAFAQTILTGISYRLAVCVFHVSQSALTLHIPSPLVTRRRQRLIDAREDYAFVFREPTKCAQTRNESTLPRSRMRFDVGVDGRVRQERARMATCVKRRLKSSAGHWAEPRNSKSFFLLGRHRDGCSKSRNASLGMPLILLALIIKRKYTLDSLRSLVLYDGRDCRHQHRPSVPDSDIAS
ncbi:hypothetical protein N431DRAFT_526148 [Stipitochalara longipes BDJ]|nr:hypothetical protein N431DRAFT_526148 [Stipitochalara longipes BDJ]